MSNHTGNVYAESDGPGEILVNARTRLGLSVEDVAGELRLSARQITALEKGDYDNLPGPTYVRGYLRNYAKLVGLSVEEVLASEAAAHLTTEPASTVSPPVERQLSSRDRLVRLVTYLLIIVMGGLVIVWWQGHQEAKVASLGSGAVPDTASGARSTAPRVAGSDRTTPAAGDAPAITSSARAPHGEPSATGTVARTGRPEAVASARRVEDAASIDTGERARLVLRYDETSWTDVRDTRQGRLLYRNVSAGETVVVEGVPPFSVFFGNAQGVQVEYNGVEYNFSPHIRGVFARFTLGSESGER